MPKTAGFSMLVFIIGGILCAYSFAAAETISPDLSCIEKIRQCKFGETREPFTAVEDLVRDSLKDKERKAFVASKLAELLVSDSSPECKLFVCRQLAVIGGVPEVPALSSLLKEPNTADMARYALERIPGKEVDIALLKEMETASGDVQLGIVHSLGNRKSAIAVSSLRRLAEKGDDNQKAAAVSALGTIGNSAAARALSALERRCSAEQREPIYRAQLRCADNLAAERKTRAALNLYRRIFRETSLAPTKAMAFCGMARLSSYPRNVKLILQALDSEDPYLITSGRRVVHELSGKKELSRLANELPKLHGQGRECLKSALLAKGISVTSE
ncbi:MAG TPA: HEAT repeat domain-containing protein [Candidatus Hydrogenedentes bacterium]|nr:HEAT repeat domain-containing protein [Candidatus Hydrogenedentota bacterium]HOL75654.1 HEAT repeat domain-containing protein [Candidatus Hydrogenedentota bacterium]HPO84353.1 HEAT repeat domain-containing protein [Candidatus Hydrogenedentota bacterium]